MNFMITVFIFLIVVFLYIHVVEQYKKSEDLEIYEMDFVDNSALQDVCNVKQPVLFEYQSFVPEIFAKLTIPSLSKNGAQYEINVKDTKDYYKTNTAAGAAGADSDFDYITFPLQSTLKLMDTDSAAHFITESNTVFIEECGLNPVIHQMDQDLKPPLTVSTNYDILFGSKDASTPLRYHTKTRYFLGVATGRVQIKMTPWRSTRYLHTIHDYDNYEHRSAINVWTPQPEYVGELSKVKFLEFDILAGNVLYIPAYWWYSIKYINESTDAQTVCFACEYSTAVNVLANITDIGRYYLQHQNTVKKTTRTLDTTASIEIPAPIVEAENDE